MKTLDDLIRAMAAKGELSHLSIAHSPRGVFLVSYRGASEGHFRHANAVDPVKAIVEALTPEPAKRKKADELDFG
jgi:hypothetical protein